MAKYGNGLNIEFVEAVKAGEGKEPFSTEDLRKYAGKRGWKPSEKYISVLLQMVPQKCIAELTRSCLVH